MSDCEGLRWIRDNAIEGGSGYRISATAEETRGLWRACQRDADEIERLRGDLERVTKQRDRAVGLVQRPARLPTFPMPPQIEWTHPIYVLPTNPPWMPTNG